MAKNASQHTGLTPKDITFRLLEEITHGFSEENKVGSGGYGDVYKGVHNGEEIAVKKLHSMPGLDDVQFKNEFYNLMRVQHQNIVRLVGYCYEVRHKHVEHNGEYIFARVEERALCLEYLGGGSLDKHLSDESCGLDWQTRYKIIDGICEGLNYLHMGSKDPTYHLDLKPANVLLDKHKVPKIADFGLSRLFATTQTCITKSFIGTVGYMPPEYIDKRQISKKFDVFSLGVIIIQIIAGPEGYSKSGEMSSQQFIELVYENWRKRWHATSSYAYASQEVDSLEVKTCIEIALRCVEADRVKRPTITEIVDELKKMDTVKRSLIAQGSGSKEEPRLVIDPIELRFPFELDKQISCVLQLTNRTDDSIAFIMKTNQAKYHARPDRGVMPPWSKRYIVVTMQAQVDAPPNMQCNDMLLLESRRVISADGITLDNVAQLFHRMTMGKEEAVEEEKLPIVYVVLPPPESPS